VCHLNNQYNGSNQHDSQEFLSFLLDGIHEDLNRLLVQPTFTRTPEQEAELERLGPQIASEQEWRLWKTRNDSVIVDFFQGQFRNRLQCLTCHTVRLSILFLFFRGVYVHCSPDLDDLQRVLDPSAAHSARKEFEGAASELYRRLLQHRDPG
jgi:ubiquitin C-terminal hydrolase